MTNTPEESDVTRQPRVVLDADGLDRLELVLGGWLPASALSVQPPPGEDLVLTDAENTPLARVRPDGTGGVSIEPLAPLTSGSGPQWDPEVRLDAATTRGRIGDRRGGEAIALLIDALPTRGDVERLRDAAHRPGVGVVVVVVPAARRSRGAGEVGWAGITRAAWAVAGDLARDEAGPRVVRLVVPRPADGTAEADLSAAGVGTVARLTDLRGSAVEADGHYPPASMRELRQTGAMAAGPGAVVFFTGLSGSGKSTIARALADELSDVGPRRVTLLDGDEVRQHLSRGLGFDAASREINIDRFAWVASLVAAHDGIAVAAPIAPFAAGRRAAREMAEQHGAFLLVWVSTPLEVCESRDRKGLYARARSGEVADFTGISSPYEEPDDADVVIDTTTVDVPEAVRRIRAALDARLANAPASAAADA